MILNAVQYLRHFALAVNRTKLTTEVMCCQLHTSELGVAEAKLDSR
jgi:hypothetical protein